MWPRVVEIMLGLWLVLSPFTFDIPGSETLAWATAITCASLVVSFGLASFWQPLRRARLGTLAVAVWLIASAQLQGRPLAPIEQNHMVVGLLLLMFSIIPSQASEPPAPWRDR